MAAGSRRQASLGRQVFADADLRVLVQAETGDVLCHVGIYRRDITWNGREMRVGGIGGVATRADSRSRGYAGIALNAAIHTLKDEGSADFAMLFCQPHNAAFYMRRGWKPFDGEIYCEQPQGRILFDAIAPYVYEIRRAPRRGTIDLCGPALVSIARVQVMAQEEPTYCGGLRLTRISTRA